MEMISRSCCEIIENICGGCSSGLYIWYTLALRAVDFVCVDVSPPVEVASSVLNGVVGPSLLFELVVVVVSIRMDRWSGSVWITWTPACRPECLWPADLIGKFGIGSLVELLSLLCCCLLPLAFVLIYYWSVLAGAAWWLRRIRS